MKIEAGRVYQAKKPKPTRWGQGEVYNDRQVLWTNGLQVQYDSPVVRNASRYPTISLEKFLTWAGEDVTDQMPNKEDWRPYVRK